MFGLYSTPVYLLLKFSRFTVALPQHFIIKSCPHTFQLGTFYGVGYGFTFSNILHFLRSITYCIILSTK